MSEDPGRAPGLRGVVAARTAISDLDTTTGILRYRGVDLADLVGRVRFDKVWGLLVDDSFDPGLEPAIPFPVPVHTGNVRVDVQSALAQLAPIWGMKPLLDTPPEEARQQLAQASVLAMSFVGQAMRGRGRPMVPQREVDKGTSITHRLMIRWQGDPDPRAVDAVDSYFIAAAEHGMNPSTLVARVIASTGADVAAALSGAVGAISGPLHGGAPERVLTMLDEVERRGEATRYVRGVLDRGGRLMGFGHGVWRGEDPRARVLRGVCESLAAPRLEAALALERTVVDQLAERFPERPMASNMEFWAAVLLDYAGISRDMFTPMFTCARLAGWSAHVLEQHAERKMIRPVAHYIGHEAREVEQVEGYRPDSVVTGSL